jgi:acyl-CoA thioester hydrolase
MAADQGKALLFVVRRMELDYLKPARLDDMLTVTTKPIELTGVRLVLDQTLERNHDLILKARVIVAAIGSDGRPTRMPADIKARLLHGENG